MSGIRVRVKEDDLAWAITNQWSYDEFIKLVIAVDEYYGDSVFTDKLKKAVKKL